ncbi:MAG: hypothetical protein QM644_17185 [Mobilitalea sp.]
MKSSQESLKKRGLPLKQDIEELSTLPQAQLIELLHSEDAITRTASANNLSAKQETVTKELLKQLQVEQCLYTRIAICKSLEKGNINTARQMIEYLGKIGNNQHKKLPDNVSKKKSFPLPRDIIARSLGKMDIMIFPVLIEVLFTKEIIKISEILDAIGYMAVYHPQLASQKNVEMIISIVGSYVENELILWKSMRCLSAI